ncbi:efflux RND transporter periplasmic adaptor subunit [Temperatibacter marinus]|uniref:Efflux RND transporter periplasmic adaptor subunit n=1 Tax=Temperatibacter marinus TaxID=1456591 RepID=A0AA52EII8_9PROT|nr:efflux RND transporter periplasmic adaptor subunit [Temperatibacter marinus]WND02939.1 efflux RND transporter periplasmic adaptor subunit [Temperatibacter marinus]
MVLKVPHRCNRKTCSGYLSDLEERRPISILVNILINGRLQQLLFCSFLGFLVLPMTGAQAQDHTVRALVEAAQSATLSSKYAGTIVHYPSELGTPFKKGDPLVVFSCEEPLASLQISKGERDSARATLKTEQELLEYDSGSEYNIQLAEAALTQAEGQYELSQLRVKDCSIQAPFSGQIIKRYSRRFQTASPGDPLLDLVNNSKLFIKAFLPSHLFTKASIGMDVFIQLDEIEGLFQARLQYKNPYIDPASQTFEIRAKILHPPKALVSGMSGVLKVMPANRKE